MADSSFVKTEGDESPATMPAAMDEDDLYEDAGDLEFYDKNDAGRTRETLYMARIPKYMWDAWLKLTERLGDDDEIQIGTLRTWNEPKPDGGADVCRWIPFHYCMKSSLICSADEVTDASRPEMP